MEASRLTPPILLFKFLFCHQESIGPISRSTVRDRTLSLFWNMEKFTTSRVCTRDLRHIVIEVKSRRCGSCRDLNHRWIRWSAPFYLHDSFLPNGAALGNPPVAMQFTSGLTLKVERWTTAVRSNATHQPSNVMITILSLDG